MKISQYSPLSSPAGSDLLPIVDVDDFSMASSGTTKNITVAALLAGLGGGGVQSVAAADASVVVSGTATNPLVATGTLDQVATLHPPAASWSNNSKKITALANGTAAQDAVAFGQTPAGGAVVSVGQGGTGATTQQGALDVLAGAVTNNMVLAGNGTHVTLRALLAADIPVLPYVQNTGGGKEVISALGSITGATTINIANANVFTATMTGNVTFTFSGATNGVACSFELYLSEDVTGGRTVTWPGSVTWIGNTTPTLATTANALNVLTFETLNGGTTWYGALVSELPALPLSISNGGTGQTTQQAAINALAGTQTVGTYLRSDGTNTTLSPIQVGDLPLKPWQFAPESYGAKGDGKVITDAVMTNASPNIAATTSLPFTSTLVDANKYILVSGAGGGTYQPKMFQISTVTDTGHAVLNANATSTTGGTPGAIAYFGTDDTAAIQSAINAAVTYASAHNGYAEVVFSDKIYIIAGAFVLGNGTTLFGNNQIALPNITPGSATQVVLMLRGAMETTPLMHWNQLAPQASGTVLASVRTDGTNDATYGPASVIGGPYSGFGGEPGLYSNSLIKVRGLGMLLPYGAPTCGIDLFSMLEADVDSFTCMAAAVVPTSSAPSPSLSTPSNIPAYSQNFTFGLRMPTSGNQVVCRIGQYSSEGMTYGLVASEWTYGEDIHIMYAIVAVGMWTRPAGGPTHVAVLVEVQAENCVNAIGPFGSGFMRVNVLSFQTESIGGNALVYDPSSQLHGTLNFWPQGAENSYASAGFVSGGTGGLNLNIYNRMSIAGPVSSPQAAPATTVAWPNWYYRDAWITVSVASGTMTALTIDAVDQPIPAGCVLWTFLLPAGHSYTPTYTGTLTHSVTLM